MTERKSFFRALLSILIMLSISVTALQAKTIPFEFIPFGSKAPIQKQIPLEWNENWLQESSFTYNHDIARVACALSDIAYADVLSQPQDNPIVRTYLKLGAKTESIRTHYDINYDDRVWGNDQCAFSLAHTDSILFITIRGTPFNTNEWLSNINISNATANETSLHEGFLKATFQVHDAVMQYIKSEKLDARTIRLLITGHSRGAAVANLLAACFATENKFPEEHMFAYTFASPNVTTGKNTNSSQFDFIWNIVNAEDIVPTLPPNRKKWSFSKYGKTRVLVNSWNTDQTTYEEQLLPKINELFTQIQGRNYCPFETGSFIPVQITMMLTGITKDVDDYYNGIARVHKKGASILEKTDMESVFAPQPNEKNSVMDKITAFLRKRTGGVSDYAAIAVKDMHALETYFSYLAALSEQEAFSTLGFSQIIIKGMPDGFVQDADGSTLLRFQEGRVQYSSIKLPVAARDKGFDSIVIGFPATQNFKIVMSKTSLAPTAIKATIEHYDAAGNLVQTHKNQKFYADMSKLYVIDAGACTLADDCIYTRTLTGAEKKKIVRDTGLSETQNVRLTFEVNLNTEGYLGYGIHFGPAKIYATLLSSTDVFNHARVVDIQPGIGTQMQITGPLIFDMEGILKCTWLLDDFAVIPSVRASLSFLPFRRVRIFAAGCADFKIDGFNDHAFASSVRPISMSMYSIADDVHIAPSVQVGIRF